jgi:hypothetical protein
MRYALYPGGAAAGCWQALGFELHAIASDTRLQLQVTTGAISN